MRYAGTSDLVWQADAKVSTFASGLILVQRSAIVRKDRAVSARASLQVGDVLPLENDPSLDGVFIFPEVQETSNASHVTFLVSGYGRANDVGQIESTPQISSETISTRTIPLTTNVKFIITTLPDEIKVTTSIVRWKSTVRRVVSKGEILSFAPPAGVDNKVYTINDFNPQVQSPSSGVTATLLAYGLPSTFSQTKWDFTSSLIVTLSERANYGNFDEETLVFETAFAEDTQSSV